MRAGWPVLAGDTDLVGVVFGVGVAVAVRVGVVVFVGTALWDCTGVLEGCAGGGLLTVAAGAGFQNTQAARKTAIRPQVEVRTRRS